MTRPDWPHMHRSDRLVHAYSDRWELVRYDRSGSWYVEWVGEPTDCPGKIGPSLYPNANQRARVYANNLAPVVESLGLTHRPGLPGGSTLDRELLNEEIRRIDTVAFTMTRRAAETLDGCIDLR